MINATILNIIKEHIEFSESINQYKIADEYMLRRGEPITSRKVRRVIEELIDDGELILSTPVFPNGGYCYGGQPGEATECVDRLRRKGIRILLRARRLKRNSQRGQLTLGLVG